MASHRLLHHSALTRQPENWAPKTAAFVELAKVSLLTNSSPTVLAAVRAGAGICAMSTAILAQCPELVMLDIPPLARIQLWLCHHRDLGGGARTKRVISWLKEVFDPLSHPWYRAEYVDPQEFDAPLRRSA